MGTLYIVLYVLLLSVFGWFVFQLKNRKLLAVAKTLPTVEPTVPILGHLHLVKTSRNFMLDMVKKAASLKISQFCVWLGPYPYIIIQDPDDIQVVLNSTKTLSKGPEYDLQKYVVGDGLLTASVNIWKPSRRQLQPMFHPRNLECMIPVFNKQGRDLVETIEKNTDKPYKDVMPYIQPLTIQSLFNFMFGPGTDLVPRKDLIDDTTYCVTRCFQLWAFRMFKIWLQSDLVFRVLHRKDLNQVEIKTHSIAEAPLQALRKRLSDSSGHAQDGAGYYSFIDAYIPLIRANPTLFSEVNFEHNICTLCAAVSDSTSIALSSCMLALAWYPDIQERLHEEVVNVIGNDERDVSLDDLKKLTYLDQVLKETLRVFTVFPILSRSTSEDIQLSFGVLPAGTPIRISIAGVHMNPSVYPKPEVFDPQRFTLEESSRRHKYSHLGFSAGARGCIGKEYGMLSMKTTMVHVIKKYRFITNADKLSSKYKFYMEQMRVGGYPVRFLPRVKQE